MTGCPSRRPCTPTSSPSSARFCLPPTASAPDPTATASATRSTGRRHRPDGRHPARGDDEGLSERGQGDRQRLARHPRRRVHGARRPFRVRQVDPPAHDRRARGGHRGPDPDRRPRRHRPPTARPRHRDGVPELRALPADDRGGEPRLRAQAAPRLEAGAEVPGRAGGGHARPEGADGTAARVPLGRPASAGGDGAGDGARAEGVPDGRAALEPRREAPRRDARRAHPAPRPARRDDRLRHPRPGRGDDPRPAGRRDARRRPAAVRHAAEAVPSAGEPLRGGIHGIAVR